MLLASLIYVPTLCLALDTSKGDFLRRASSTRNVPPLGYYVPTQSGGNMLTVRCYH